jgi:hypothetical protein
MKMNYSNKIYWLGATTAAVFCFTIAAPTPAIAQRIGISISVGTAPPPLIVYDQPPAPAPDYIWTPGYWAWGDAGYFWVPGAWVLAPEPGLLWTPGYWAYTGTVYGWHPGYWATRVGFYGGVNYGFGYFGAGYVGGRWNGRHFLYNTAVTRVNTRVVRNVYVDRTVVVHNNVANRRGVARVSYNGGRGGIIARPRVPEPVARERRPMTGEQVQRERGAAPQGHRAAHPQAPPNARRDR